MSTPRVLVIAGSDSSGGAGLEADQKVLAVHGVFAMTATTAVTAQNTNGVRDVHVTPPAFVEKQIRAVLEDGFLGEGKGVVKIGMLASTETISTVAKVLEEYDAARSMKIVLDPVMVSTSGHQLLPGDAVSTLRQRLLPMTSILTPNIPEALLLLREAHPDRETDYRSPSNLEDLKQLARNVQALGPTHVLLKGGHMPLNKSYTKATSDADKALTIDILYPSESNNTTNTTNEAELEVIESPYLSSLNTHGTGCSLASALAAQLALTGQQQASASLAQLTRNAVTYISHTIRFSSPPFFNTNHTGAHGPVNHFHSTRLAAYPCPDRLTGPQVVASLVTTQAPSTAGPLETYLLSHRTIAPLWARYTQSHPFTTALARGTLPIKVFRHYMIQDYLYLTHFARTYALAAYKARNMRQITANAVIILHIEREMQLHLQYCSEFGITKQQIEGTRESVACQAYSRYILDIGAAGDLLGLYVALAPCLLGYGVVAQRLYDDPESKREGNVYWRWVENYVAEDYKEAVGKGRVVLEEEGRRQGVSWSEGRLEELVEVFREATRLEVGFWEEGAHLPNEDEERQSTLENGQDRR